MRIVVVGGAGFVGGHVVDALQKEGHDVMIFDMFPSKFHPALQFFKGTINDMEALATAFHGAQVVMHLAAVSNTQAALRNPVECVRVNILGTTMVLEAARLAGVERVLVAGSTLVSQMLDHTYTALDELAFIEPRPTERHPYVTSKVATEMVALDYAECYGLPVTVFRYGIQYGPRMTPGVVAHAFIERALKGEPLVVSGDGSQWRQYMHVYDLAAAHVQAIEMWDRTENEVFNICGMEKVTILDMANAVAKVVPGTTIEFGPERPGDIEVQFMEPQRAKAQFGWEAKISLEDGIASTVAWYRRHLASGMPRRKR